MQTTVFDSGMLCDSPSPLSPAPSNAHNNSIVFNATNSTESGFEFPIEPVVRRRRSTHVSGPAPDMKELYGSSASASAVTLEGGEGGRREEQGQRQSTQWGLMNRLSNAFAGGSGSSASLLGVAGSAAMSSSGGAAAGASVDV